MDVTEEDLMRALLGQTVVALSHVALVTRDNHGVDQPVPGYADGDIANQIKNQPPSTASDAQGAGCLSETLSDWL